jgi:hypothetical protein
MLGSGIDWRMGYCEKRACSYSKTQGPLARDPTGTKRDTAEQFSYLRESPKSAGNIWRVKKQGHLKRDFARTKLV